MSISVFKNPNSQYSPSLSNFFYTLPRWNGFKFTGRMSKSLSWVKRKSIVCYSTDGVSSLDKNNSSLSENLDLTKEIENESDVLIECKDVHKAFGVKQILKGVSFKIRHGEAVGIIGTSGTGKSTVLKIIAGLLTPDKGEVFVHGKKRVGLVSDEEFLGVRVGLGVEECLPSELSGGMKKRVALARSIIYDNTTNAVQPKVLLYDEPTAGLDPIASTVVEDLIRSVHLKPDDTNKKQGKIASYVVVTHQHSTIRRAVDRLLFLHEGRIIWEGMTHEFTSSTNPIVRQFASGSLDGPIIY